MRKPLLAEEPRPDVDLEQVQDEREAARPAPNRIQRLHSELGNAALGRLVENRKPAEDETAEPEQSEEKHEYSQQVEFEEPEHAEPVVTAPARNPSADALPEVIKPGAKPAVPGAGEGEVKEQSPGVPEPEPMEGGPVAAATGDAATGAPEMANAIAGISVPLAQSSALLGAPVVFAPRENEDSDEPWLVYETARKRAESEAAATSFLARNAQHAVDISSLALTIPSRLLAASESAKANIDESAARNVAEIVAAIASKRARAEAEASNVVGSVVRERDEVKVAIPRITAKVKADIQGGYKIAEALLRVLESGQIIRIGLIYADADPDLRKLGTEVGNEAIAIAQKRADSWLRERNGESSFLDGPIHDNRLEAKAEAALNVAKEYKKSLEEAAGQETYKVMAAKPETVQMVSDIAGQACTGLWDHLQAIHESLVDAETRAINQVEKLSSQIVDAVQASLRATLTSLANQQAAQVDRIHQYAQRQKDAVDRDTAQAAASLVEGASEGASGFNEALMDLVESALETEAPDAEALAPILVETQAETDALAAGVLEDLAAGIESSEASLAAAGTDAVESINALGVGAREQADATADGLSENLEIAGMQATGGLRDLLEGYKNTALNITASAIQGFNQATDGLAAKFTGLAGNVSKSLEKTAADLKDGLRGALKDLNSKIDEFAKKAADQVQPRWKNVLKVLLVIVVIVAVVLITIATAGALGPVGVLALGVLLGGLAGGLIQIGNNLIDGKKWSEDLDRAIVVGMIGGLFGGVGGMLGKLVANVGLRIALELGVDALGGIVGDLYAGNPITLASILLGAGIGLGVTGGLKVLSVLKGKIKIKPQVETPTIKPDVDVPKAIHPTTETPLPHPPAGGPEPPVRVPHAETPPPPHPEVPEPKPKNAAVEPEKPMKPHPGEAAPQAMRTAPDGHEWKLNDRGDLVRCSERCVKVEALYKDVMDAGMKDRLNDIKAKLKSESAKVRKQAIGDLDAFEADLKDKVKARAESSSAVTKGRPEATVDAPDKNVGPSGKRWDDPTMTPDEFIKDYQAKYPNSEMSGDIERLKKAFEKGQRLNPETGELKRPVRPMEATGAREIPKPGDKDYDKWQQWLKYDLKDPNLPICFVAGTLVKTPAGERPIEELRAGDGVLSYDFASKSVVQARVSATFKNWTRFVVEIDAGQATIASTLSHPCWVEDESCWVRARDIQPGMSLRSAGGQIVKVETVRHCAAEESTYNFEVEDHHNYFAGRAGLLVHNGTDDTSKFLNTDTYNTTIYEVVDTKKNKVIYVGQSGGPNSAVDVVSEIASDMVSEPIYDPHSAASLRFKRHVVDPKSAVYQYFNDPLSPGYVPPNHPLRKSSKFPLNILRCSPVEHGNWTEYEAAVREQHRMNLHGGKGGGQLANKIDAITYEKFVKFRKLHNGCI